MTPAHRPSLSCKVLSKRVLLDFDRNVIRYFFVAGQSSILAQQAWSEPWNSNTDRFETCLLVVAILPGNIKILLGTLGFSSMQRSSVLWYTTAHRDVYDLPSRASKHRFMGVIDLLHLASTWHSRRVVGHELACNCGKPSLHPRVGRACQGLFASQKSVLKVQQSLTTRQL